MQMILTIIFPNKEGNNMAERYYWLKLQRDFFKRHDVRIVESMQNGKDYVLFYLKLLCESIDHEGRLRFSDSIPYNDEMLSTITNTNIDIVRSAVKIFTELGLMEILSDGTFFMNEVQKMIGSAANNANALRQQRFRDTHRNQPVLPDNNSSVTKSNASVTGCVTESDESKNKSKSQSKNNNFQEEEDSNDNNTEENGDEIRFLHLFNSIDGIVPCSDLTAARKACISIILSTYSIPEIGEAFNNLSDSKILTGKIIGTNGKAFNATFDWFIDIANFKDVFEGKYTRSEGIT